MSDVNRMVFEIYLLNIGWQDAQFSQAALCFCLCRCMFVFKLMRCSILFHCCTCLYVIRVLHVCCANMLSLSLKGDDANSRIYPASGGAPVRPFYQPGAAVLDRAARSPGGFAANNRYIAIMADSTIHVISCFSCRYTTLAAMLNWC